MYGHGLGRNPGQRLHTLTHRCRELRAHEDEVGGDDRRGAIAVREHERLAEERLLRALGERPPSGPAADRDAERRRDVDARETGGEAQSRSSACTSRPITASLSPCVVVAIARI